MSSDERPTLPPDSLDDRAAAAVERVARKHGGGAADCYAVLLRTGALGVGREGSDSRGRGEGAQVRRESRLQGDA